MRARYIPPATVLLLGLILWGAVTHVPARVGVNQDVHNSPRRVPSAATTVSYYEAGLMGPNSAFECHIAEADFETWSRGKGWTPSEIREPASIARYSYFCRNGDMPLEATITDGWLIHIAYENSGFHRIIYDRVTGKMYYRYASR